MNGSTEVKVTQNITLSCISHEARELLDRIVEEYQKHYDDMIGMNLKCTSPDDVYGAFYWLTRYSGLIQSAVQE